jgi:hypothetical protein
MAIGTISAATATAEPDDEPPGMRAWSVPRGLCGVPKCGFAEVGLADADHPGTAQQAHAGGIEQRGGRCAAVGGAGGGDAAGYVEQVFPGQGYTIEHTQGLAGTPTGGGRFGFTAGAFGGQGNKYAGRAARLIECLFEGLHRVAATAGEILGQ